MKFFFLIILIFFQACSFPQKAKKFQAPDHKPEDRIQPYTKNPFYWQYKGKPVLLTGGSHEDNLFNHPEGLEQHLDILRAAGGNYIRNTMSSRNPGNPMAFKKLNNGLYDLDQWNDEYRDRFENFLKLTFDRDIILQIEIWDPWDFFRSEAALGFGAGNVGWESCPFNPSLNINYTSDETGLENTIDYTLHTPNKHLFFQTIPALKNIKKVLKYQEAFVSKILDISLKYPNVLYNIRNECREHEEWSKYWAVFIREKALKEDKQVFITDMRRSENFASPEQMNLLNDRIHFSYIDISQNNHLTARGHYDQILFVRDVLLKNPVPMNNVKIYGGVAGWTSGIEEGTRRFWRNVFGGCASVRFHREGPSEHFFGIGLSELAQIHLKSMRMFSGEFKVYNAIPSNQILTGHDPDKAYCLAETGKQYSVYFTDGGEVILDLTHVTGQWNLIWLDISGNRWTGKTSVNGGVPLSLKTPGSGHWIALLKQK